MLQCSLRLLQHSFWLTNFGRAAEKRILQRNFCNATSRNLQRNFRFRLWHVAGVGFRTCWVRLFLYGWSYPGVRLQIWVCLICVASSYSNGALQIRFWVWSSPRSFPGRWTGAFSTRMQRISRCLSTVSRSV